jgi:predicted RNA-binding protein with RPS1 domain
VQQKRQPNHKSEKADEVSKESFEALKQTFLQQLTQKESENAKLAKKLK